MNKNTKPMPRLDLAPKLNRPLSLWNPWDYLRLLYWVFYFPQALRWYVETFGGGYIPKEEMNLRQGLQIPRENAIQRQLLIQGIVLILVTPTLFCWSLEQFGFAIDWEGVAYGVAYGVAFGAGGAVGRGVAIGVAEGVGVGVGLGVALGVGRGVVAGVGGSVGLGVAEGVALGVGFGVVIGVAGGVAGGVVAGVGLGVAGGVAGGVVVGVGLGVAAGVGGALAGALALGVAVGVAVGVAIFRPDNWLLSTPVNAFTLQNASWLFPRITILPLANLQKRLKKTLSSNWEEGLHNSNELLRYSHQFIPVVSAVNTVLAETPCDHLIWKVSRLADQPFDWKLVAFASISLKEQMQATFVKSFLFWRIYKRHDHKITESPRLDTLPHATAAGFWCLHEKKSAEATEAFKVVRHILYGEEMYILALTLDLCNNAKEFNQIQSLTLPPCPEANPEKRLRQISWQSLEAFHRVTQEAQLIHPSRSKATRAQALARAQEELKQILDNSDRLPQAEGGLIIDIATTWRDALLNITNLYCYYLA